MLVSECRWAERRRKEPSARSGENRAALLGEDSTVVRVFSNASHGQLATLVCASVTVALSSVRSDRAMLLEELTGLDTGGRRVRRAVNFS